MEYMVAKGKTAQELEVEVKAYIVNGFEPFGNMSVTQGNFYQVMVRK